MREESGAARAIGPAAGAARTPRRHNSELNKLKLIKQNKTIHGHNAEGATSATANTRPPRCSWIKQKQLSK